MSDASPPDTTADALADALDTPTTDEWREAVRVFGRTAVVFARVAPALSQQIEAMATAFIAIREPVAAVLALQQPAPPKELPDG